MLTLNSQTLTVRSLIYQMQKGGPRMDAWSRAQVVSCLKHPVREASGMGVSITLHQEVI
jgi:hypothetical protein